MGDGHKPAGDSYFNSSYTGPTLYTPQDKYQKMTFEKIEKAAAEDERTGKDTAMKSLHPVRADGGWFAISQHFFVSAFVPPANIARDIFTKKLATNTYAIGNLVTLPAPSCTRVRRSRICSNPCRLAWNWSRIMAG